MSSQILQVVVQGKNDTQQAFQLTRQQVVDLVNATKDGASKMVDSWSKVGEASSKSARTMELAHSAALREAERRAAVEAKAFAQTAAVQEQVEKAVVRTAQAQAKAARDIELAHGAAAREAQKRSQAEIKALRDVEVAQTAALRQQAELAKRTSDAQIASWQASGRAAREIGTTLTAAVTVPLVAGAAAAVKAAISYESAFAGVRKTVDATEPQLKKLSDGFRQMSKEIPLSAVELAKIGENAGQLGIRQEAILGFTKVMAQLGVTTNLSADEAGTSLAQLANITQMSQENFDRLGSSLVALGNEGASTERHITAMALRLAGAGHQVGMTQHQILGVAAALANVGIKAEAGGSAISRVLVDMQLAVARGGNALQDFARVSGMSAAQFAKLFRQDAAAGLDAFVTGLARLKAAGGDVIKTLDDMGVREVRERDAIMRLAGANDQLTKSLKTSKDAWSANTALSKEAQERFKTTESALTLLWNRLVDVAREIGNALTPQIRSLADTIQQSLLPTLEKAVKWFTSLPDWTQKTAFGIAGIAAAVGPAVLALNKMGTAVSNVMKLTMGVTLAQWAASMGGLKTAIGFVIGSFAALAFKVGVAVAGFAASYWITDWILKFTGLRDAINGVIDKLTGLHAIERQVAAENAIALERRAASVGPGPQLNLPGLGLGAGASAWRAQQLARLGLGAPAGTAVPPPPFPGLGSSTFFSSSGLEYQSSLYGLDRSTQDRIRKLLKDSMLRTAQDQRDAMKQTYELNRVIVKQYLDGQAEDEEALAKFRRDTHKLASREEKKFWDEQIELADRYGRDLLKNLTRQQRDWKQAGSEVHRVFADLGQQVGGAWGAVIGNVGASLNALTRMNKAGLGKFFASTKGQDTLAAVQGGIDAFFGGMGIGGMLGSPGKGALAGAGAGAGTGALVGTMIAPGIGTAIGAAGGALLGALGGLFGGKKAQEDQRRAMAEMRQQLLDNFGGMAALQKKASELGIDISRAFSTKSPREFEAVVKQLDSALAAQQKRWQGIQTALQGLDLMTKGFMKNMEANGLKVGFTLDVVGEKMERFKKRLQEEGHEIDPTTGRFKDPEANERMRQRERQLGGGVGKATEEQMAAFKRLGDYAAAVFGAMVLENGNVIGALREMEPILDQLASAMDRFGLEGSAALNELLGLRQVMIDNEGIAQMIEGLNMLTRGLTEAGLMTSTMAQNIGKDAASAFAELRSKGVDANQAMLLMQPTLQALWERQKQFGDITDQATLALLNQAETAGLVGENQKSIYTKILDVLKEIRDTLKGLDGKTVNTRVNVNTHHTTTGDRGGNRGGLNDDGSEDRDGRPWTPYAGGGRVPFTPGGHRAIVAEQQTETILSDNQIAHLLARAMAMAGGGAGAPAGPVYIAMDPRLAGSGSARQITRGEFRQIEAAMGSGAIRVASRAISSRTP
jgi:TP901 family phage tail tape measure protein